MAFRLQQSIMEEAKAGTWSLQLKQRPWRVGCCSLASLATFVILPRPNLPRGCSGYSSLGVLCQLSIHIMPPSGSPLEAAPPCRFPLPKCVELTPRLTRTGMRSLLSVPPSQNYWLAGLQLAWLMWPLYFLNTWLQTESYSELAPTVSHHVSLGPCVLNPGWCCHFRVSGRWQPPVPVLYASPGRVED